MSYTPPPPGPYQPENVPTQRQNRRRPGTGMLIAGLIMIGVSVIGGIIAIVTLTISSVNQFQDFADSTYSIDQAVTVDGLGDNHWYLYQDPNITNGANCTVTDQQGNDVTRQSVDLEMDFNDVAYESIQSFESTADGVYEISCTNYPVALGGSMPFGGFLGIGIAVLSAGILFLAGAVLTIIGLVRRSRSKKQQYPPYGGSPYPGAGPAAPPQYPTPHA